MQPRRSLRLMAGALVLALPLLGSCGFNKATEQIYTPGAGTNYRAGDVDVLSAVVVAAQPSSGTFIASLSNKRSDKAFTLIKVAGAGDSTDLTVNPSSLSVKIPARGFVNLVDQTPITVQGDFTPGQVLELTLSFDSGDTVTMDVPVVYACNYYEGLDKSASGAGASPTTSPTGSPTTSPTTSPTASPTRTAHTASPTATPTGSPTPASTASPFDCSAVGEG